VSEEGRQKKMQQMRLEATMAVSLTTLLLTTLLLILPYSRTNSPLLLQHCFSVTTTTTMTMTVRAAVVERKWAKMEFWMKLKCFEEVGKGQKWAQQLPVGEETYSKKTERKTMRMKSCFAVVFAAAAAAAFVAVPPAASAAVASLPPAPPASARHDEKTTRLKLFLWALLATKRGRRMVLAKSCSMMKCQSMHSLQAKTLMVITTVSVMK
jgi:hypothetical protein